MTTRILDSTATATVDTTEVVIEGGRTTLSTANVPYATATLELPPLSDELVAWLDPRNNIRVPHEASMNGGTPRTFDLGVRRRSIDDRTKRVTLELASDEALLMKYVDFWLDQGAREHETSVRAICNYVLDKIGAALEPGTDDADVSAAWPLTNLCLNPSAEAVTGYVAGVNAGSVSVGTTSPYHGAGYVRWVSIASGASFLAVPISDTRVTAGQTFTFNAYLRASAASQQGRLYVQYKDSDGNVVGNGALGPLGTLATGTAWSEHSWTFTVPEGVVEAQPYVVGVGGAGITYAVDGVSYYEDDEFVSFFTGSSSDSIYTYSWVGAVGASPSVRTPVIERRPEMFLWYPDTYAWDFLIPITAVAGLVLWCDEQRRWWLSTPENRAIASTVTVTADTASDAFDDIDLDDDETTPTGVAVKHTWTDKQGNPRVEYDLAGDPERVLMVTLEGRAYTGVGTAQNILDGRLASARRQTLTAIGQMDTTPGMSADVTLPHAGDEDRRIEAVTFDHRTGFMDLTTVGVLP